MRALALLQRLSPTALAALASRLDAPSAEVRSLAEGMRSLRVATRVLEACATQKLQRDLVRICTEIREELEPEMLPLEAAPTVHGGEAGHAGYLARQIAGAVYVSCAGRGGPHFGSPSAELAIVRHALGDVPLVGFFANGEIAHRHLYGYTGVLTVFASPAV